MYEIDDKMVAEPRHAKVKTNVCGIIEEDELPIGYPINPLIAHAFTMMPDGSYDGFEISYHIVWDMEDCDESPNTAVEAYMDEGTWKIHVYENEITEKF